LDAVGDGVIAADLAGNVLFLNREAERLTGWSGAEAEGRPLGDVFALREEAAVPGRLRLAGREGDGRAVDARTMPLEGPDGGVCGTLHVFREPAVAGRETVEWLDAILDPVCVVDGEGRIRYANPAAEVCWRRGADGSEGQSFWEGFSGEIRATLREAFDRALIGAGARGRAVDVPGPGGEVWRFHLSPCGDGWLAWIRDVTDEAEAEREARRTERLEALGHLARGFSHGFNNLLTVILGNLSLAEALSRDEMQRGQLAEAIHAARKAQGLVQQIMVFARGAVPVKGLLPIAPLLRQIVQERQADHPEVEYHTAFDALEIVVRADPKQLRRLVENLLENAEQAVSGRGRVSLRCRTETGSGDEGTRLVIEVADPGAGMEPEVLARAFEPFYTTRQAANATGLGLTVCESIARAHGGTVEVRSEPGRGTAVTVRLPLALPGEAGTGADRGMGRSVIRGGHPVRRGGRILVLEDESLIRRLIQSTLSQAGHRVDEARDGETAIQAYRQAQLAGDPYDLLIMDLTIENGMGGVEALRRIRELNPRVCAIVSSGYSDDPAMAEPQRFGFSGVLPKPYQPVELVEAVESMLGRMRQAGSA
jgi:signal transduction histidine kinase/CheY-like chemotaxis protein